MKKTKYLLLIALTLILIVTGCADSDKSSGSTDDERDENLNKSGFPIVNDEINLDFFAGQAPATHPDWNDVLIFNHYEEMTNIEIDWEMAPTNAIAEQRNLALGSGNLPDAFHSAGLTISDLTKYGDEGVFLPLNDLIAEYAPNFKKILDENPAIENSITMADGNIYSFPMISDPEFASHRIQARPFIHKEWLDELKLTMPETTDEFYEFLKAVKEKNPSKGKIEETPFGGPGIDTLVNYLKGSFGLANRGSSNANIDADPETGELRFFPISDQYKDFMAYLHKLFEEELIEQNIYSIDHTQFIANLGEAKYGSVVWFAPEEVSSPEGGAQYIGMPTLKGPYGDKTLTQIGVPVLVPGAFVITSANEHPEATVRWIDYFYGEEGMKLFFMGVEGETYQVDENGKLKFVDKIINSEEGLSFEQEVAKYLTFPGGGFPSMVTQELFQGVANAPQSLEASDKLEANLINDDDIWPILTHTKEENDELQGFGSDIETYVIEMRDRFISGQEPLSNWDDYIKELDRMGLERYLELKNNALQRQLNTN